MENVPVAQMDRAAAFVGALCWKQHIAYTLKFGETLQIMLVAIPSQARKGRCRD